MSEYEPMISSRLELRQGEQFASVAIHNVRAQRWLALLISSSVAAIALLWVIWQFWETRGSIEQTLLPFGLVLAVSCATRSWGRFRTAKQNAKKITVTRDLINIESFRILGRGQQTLVNSAIDAVRVVPDTFSRPFRGFPYRRKHHHLTLHHAGEDLHLFKGLSHAEALAVAAAILPGTNCVQAEDHSTTPNVTRLNDLSQPCEEEGNHASLADSRYLCVAQSEGRTDIVLRRRFPRFRLPALLVAAIWGPILIYHLLHTAADASHAMPSLLLGLLFIMLIQFFADWLRKETVSISVENVEHRIFRPIGTKTYLYRAENIRDLEISNETEKVFVESDFESKPIFNVCFDYGQNTRHIGCRMTYVEAKFLANILSKQLTERRQAA